MIRALNSGSTYAEITNYTQRRSTSGWPDPVVRLNLLVQGGAGMSCTDIPQGGFRSRSQMSPG
jgi:hypothetical protein